MPNCVGDEKVSPFNGGALTIPGSISGYPAISIPAGVSENGLPIGIQAYARRHEDARLLSLALVMESAHPLAAGRSRRPNVAGTPNKLPSESIVIRQYL